MAQQHTLDCSWTALGHSKGSRLVAEGMVELCRHVQTAVEDTNLAGGLDSQRGRDFYSAMVCSGGILTKGGDSQNRHGWPPSRLTSHSTRRLSASPVNSPWSRLSALLSLLGFGQVSLPGSKHLVQHQAWELWGGGWVGKLLERQLGKGTATAVVGLVYGGATCRLPPSPRRLLG